MRIALLQDHLRNGGTEQQTLAIAAGLAASGIETHVIIFRKGGALEAQAANQAYQLHHLNQGPLKTDWYAPGLRQFLTTLAPNAVIPMGRMANCLTALLPRNRTYKLLATFRTGRSIPYLYRHALRTANHLVANSHNALTRLATTHRIHRPDTSTVIHNGCIRNFTQGRAASPRPPLHHSPLTIHYSSVSMFRPQKQQIRLIRICSQLPPDIDWKLTLAGTGPTRAACQAEASRLNLTDRITFPGLLTDPRPLYQTTDVALHTSDQESLPNFLVEAQMAGIPVIAYNVDGVSETFLPEKSGYLIPHKNEQEFLAKLISLSRNPIQRQAYSQAAHTHAISNFSLQSQTTAYKTLLTQLIHS